MPLPKVKHMKKVLVIAFLYPPIFNSGTRRSLEFVNHLPDNGWEPTVLTVANPSPGECDDSLLDEVRPGTKIVRVPLWGAHIGAKIGAALGFLWDKQRIADGIAWRVRRWWSVPDECASWVPMAVAQARRLHAEEPFDAIYATGWPWSSFLVAEKVGKATGVPYVVDYRDLWKPSDVEWDQHSRWQRRLNPALERRVLRGAAGVIATTRSFLRLLPQELLKQHQFAITNGFDPDDFPARAAAAPQDEVRIVYTGVWRAGYGPDDLFEAVRLLHARGLPSLRRLKLVVAGFPQGKAKEYGIEQFVVEKGRIQHAEAIDLMMGASALYLPVSKGFYEHASIPGKLFEYFGSGSPILASAQAVSEVAAALDHVGGARRVDPGDIEALAAVLASLCDGNTNGIFGPRNEAALASYTRGGLTAKLAAALDSVSAPASEPVMQRVAGQ